MKTIKIILAALMLAGININFANTDDDLLKQVKALSYEASIKFDEGKLRQASALCERILSEDDSNIYARYYLAYSQYQLLQVAMTRKDQNLFDQFFSAAVDNGKLILQEKSFASEANVLLASIYMMKIAITPQEAPQLSMKIHSYLDDAVKANVNNPRAYLIRGQMLYNTPEMYGGSVDKAIDLWNNALLLFAGEKEKSFMPDWGLLDTYAWLGQAFTRKGKVEDAKSTYEKALSIEPNFGWVKYVLLPGLDKKQ